MIRAVSLRQPVLRPADQCRDRNESRLGRMQARGLCNEAAAVPSDTAEGPQRIWLARLRGALVLREGNASALATRHVTVLLRDCQSAPDRRAQRRATKTYS